jgi:hypothetical protein
LIYSSTLPFIYRPCEDENKLLFVFSCQTGEEDDFELKLESIIEGCNGTWLRNQGRMCQYLDDQCLPPSVKSKRLTEAVLTLQSPCQARHVLY